MLLLVLLPNRYLLGPAAASDRNVLVDSERLRGSADLMLFCLLCFPTKEVAMGQNLRYLYGDDYPPKIVYFKGFLGVHRGYGVLTHCQVSRP